MMELNGKKRMGIALISDLSRNLMYISIICVIVFGVICLISGLNDWRKIFLIISLIGVLLFWLIFSLCKKILYPIKEENPRKQIRLSKDIIESFVDDLINEIEKFALESVEVKKQIKVELIDKINEKINIDLFDRIPHNLRPYFRNLIDTDNLMEIKVVIKKYIPEYHLFIAQELRSFRELYIL